MKTKLLIPGLCLCINSLIGHPVFDAQKGYWIDNKFPNINYQELIDYQELFCKIVKSSKELKAISIKLQKLCSDMTASIREFISTLQIHYSLDEIKDKNKFIELKDEVKDAVGLEKISLASAVWLYQVIYASPEEISNGDLKNIQADYDAYLESLPWEKSSDSFDTFNFEEQKDLKRR